jgi:hypothetical protein
VVKYAKQSFNPARKSDADRSNTADRPANYSADLSMDAGPVLFQHQQDDFERYKDASEMGIFWEMGCVDGETEYFSQDGWKKIAEYTKYDKVLQWSGWSAELVDPLKVIRKRATELYHFNTGRGIDQVLSGDHRVISYRKGRNGFVKRDDMTVDEMLVAKGKPSGRFCRLAFNRYESSKLWPYTQAHTQLMLALLIYGRECAQPISDAENNWPHYIKVPVTMTEQSARIEELLKVTGAKCARYKYSIKQGASKDLVYYYYIDLEVMPITDTDWYDCPPEWVTSDLPYWKMRETYDIYGGYVDDEYCPHFETMSSRLADFIQFMYVSQNKRAQIKYERFTGTYNVVLPKESQPYAAWYTSKKPQKVKCNYQYCFTVPSGYLVLRRNGCVFITGNCGKSALVLRIAGHKFKTEQINALLVIAPNDLHVQWYKEQIPLWLDVPYNIQCLFGRGGQKKTYAFDVDPAFLQVVCVNIDTFSTPNKWQDIADWANAMRTFIVLDEATTIKNVSAQRTQRILYSFNNVIRKNKTILKSEVKSVARAVLTGTPVTNGPMDLWAICEFLRPNFFGRNWYSFKNYYGMFTSLSVSGVGANGEPTARAINIPLNEERWHGIKGCLSYEEAAAIFGCSVDTFNTVHSQDSYKGPYKHADELKDKLKSIASFRLLRECVDMPEETRVTRALNMTPEIQSCYNSMVKEYVAEYDKHVATALNKLTVIIRLQQISSGFICDKQINTVNDDDPDAFISRLYELDVTPDEIQWIGASNPKLDALYRDIDEAEKPVIVITRFSAEASRIYEDLSKRLACCLITGWKRVGTIEEFKEGKYDVMVANSAVINRGFNLQNSHTMCFYSNSFSLEQRLQAEGRIYRVGQTHTCMYLDYCYDDTVDLKVISALKLKRNLLDYIRDADIRELVYVS